MIENGKHGKRGATAHRQYPIGTELKIQVAVVAAYSDCPPSGVIFNSPSASEGARRHPEDALEVAMQLALIEEADARRDLGLRHAAREQLLREAHAAMRDVRVRW